MLKLNTSTILKTLDDKEIQLDNKPASVGKVLADILATSAAGGKMKLYTLAHSLYEAKGSIELDAADVALLKTSVDQSTNYVTIVTGQLLLILENLKEVTVKKK